LEALDLSDNTQSAHGGLSMEFILCMTAKKIEGWVSVFGLGTLDTTGPFIPLTPNLLKEGLCFTRQKQVLGFIHQTESVKTFIFSGSN
jgi:hypothetical protein